LRFTIAEISLRDAVLIITWMQENYNITNVFSIAYSHSFYKIHFQCKLVKLSNTICDDWPHGVLYSNMNIHFIKLFYRFWRSDRSINFNFLIYITQWMTTILTSSITPYRNRNLF
jgi:hypothetical protein